ncbi:hypothetical protein CCHR01_07774 [Colletotrichum chrysophilum]|uniref:Uncharacterized protein n=1 Tax=Colletotrichum chrysophilum TaxID=1836956 RepID=A0AAD9AK57_9PEZI|nr:hypothetical protein CCHR01_07774 [Colletotrichum chrysophilum]
MPVSLPLDLKSFAASLSTPRLREVLLARTPQSAVTYRSSNRDILRSPNSDHYESTGSVDKLNPPPPRRPILKAPPQPASLDLI